MEKFFSPSHYWVNARADVQEWSLSEAFSLFGLDPDEGDTLADLERELAPDWVHVYGTESEAREVLKGLQARAGVYDPDEWDDHDEDEYPDPYRLARELSPVVL